MLIFSTQLAGRFFQKIQKFQFRIFKNTDFLYPTSWTIFFFQNSKFQEFHIFEISNFQISMFSIYSPLTPDQPPQRPLC